MSATLCRMQSRFSAKEKKKLCRDLCFDVADHYFAFIRKHRIWSCLGRSMHLIPCKLTKFTITFILFIILILVLLYLEIVFHVDLGILSYACPYVHDLFTLFPP